MPLRQSTRCIALASSSVGTSFSIPVMTMCTRGKVLQTVMAAEGIGDFGELRPRALLRNIRRIVVVTTHGSSKLTNALEGESGKRTVTRAIRRNSACSGGSSRWPTVS